LLDAEFFACLRIKASGGLQILGLLERSQRLLRFRSHLSVDRTGVEALILQSFLNFSHVALTCAHVSLTAHATAARGGLTTGLITAALHVGPGPRSAAPGLRAA
jgi:hypothetical protein